MNRLVLGAVATLLLLAAGLFWLQGRAELERGAPPPDLSAPAKPGDAPIVLPSADADGRRGPGLPGSARAQQSKEDRRFNRFDRNRDGRIDRTEMLSTRVKAFQKLDLDHNNLLTFEEWAVKTSNSFKEVDRNGDGVVSRAELDGYYAAKEAKPKHERCACGKPAPAGKGAGKPPADDGDGDPSDAN
jgi:hypothetical protein